MKKLFVHLEKEIPISELEEYLEEFESQTKDKCLSIFLANKDMHLVILCDHPFTGAAKTSCSDCRICKKGNYDREKILDYIKNGTRYSRRGNLIMK